MTIELFFGFPVYFRSVFVEQWLSFLEPRALGTTLACPLGQSVQLDVPSLSPAQQTQKKQTR